MIATMAPGSATEIGMRLRELREGLGKSMRQVQEATEISSGHLSLIETGQVKNPSPTVLHRLAEYYEADPEDFLILAGYLKPRDERAARKAVVGVALAAMRDLDDSDIQQINTMIQVLRERKKRTEAG